MSSILGQLSSILSLLCFSLSPGGARLQATSSILRPRRARLELHSFTDWFQSEVLGGHVQALTHWFETLATTSQAASTELQSKVPHHELQALATPLQAP